METGPESNISPRYDDKQPSAQCSLSSSHQDLFEKLATETIAQIFNHVCQTVDIPERILQDSVLIGHYPNPEILSLVCKRWRAISTTTHSLWATITIKPTEIDEEEWEEWGFSQLRRHLERSGTYPLDICIDDNHGGSDAVILSILDIAILYSERWRSITFEFELGRDLVQKIDTLTGRLPLLQHLGLYLSNSRYSEDISKATAFLGAPTLNSVCIVPSSGRDILRKICIPRTQISEIAFEGRDFENEEDLREILAWISASLTSLTFWELYHTRASPRPFSRVITLLQLRRLCLSHDRVAVLDMFICPALEELKIYNGDQGTITRFLDCSSCALTHFKLCSLNNYDRRTYETLLKHSSLSTLRSISLAEITDQCLDLFNFDSLQMFPSLETLRLHLRIETYHDSDTRQLVYVIEKLRKVVDSRTCTASLDPPELVEGLRSSLKTCVFHLNLELEKGDTRDYWKEEPIRALKLFCITRKVLVSLKITYSWVVSRYMFRSHEYELNENWDLNFP